MFRLFAIVAQLHPCFMTLLVLSLCAVVQTNTIGLNGMLAMLVLGLTRTESVLGPHLRSLEAVRKDGSSFVGLWAD
jgi:ABC-type nickel/cobalt efflux system permease component RcnA